MQAVGMYRTSIGKKVVMAFTGVIWIGYVVLHMYGNLKAFVGAEYFNAYAEGLREMGGPIFGHLQLLIIARIIFVVSIVLHVWSAWSLYRQAANARPISYSSRRVVRADYAGRTMRYGGVVILLFLIFHLAQLTWGVKATNSAFVTGDPYHNLVAVFQSPIVTGFYLVALFALGFHLYHGAWSMFQTLGLNSHEYDGVIRGLAILLAICVPIGFAAVPLAVQFGILT
ncbi:MAG: succinate dehydrogenase cytochrome b subunit [Caldilineaceae bacterium]